MTIGERGTTAPCGDTEDHAEHVWVRDGTTAPVVCKGYRYDVRQIMNAAVGREVGAVFPLHATQEALDGLAEQVADMLDNAMHLEACWISEDETRCECIIGKLRAVLPRCGHVETIGTKGLTRQCLSTVHPSAPYKHVFGTV